MELGTRSPADGARAADAPPAAPTGPQPPDVLALPLDVARERLSSCGFEVSAVETTSAWRPEPPAGAEWRVVRQRSSGEAAVSLVIAPFRPPAEGDRG